MKKRLFILSYLTVLVTAFCMMFTAHAATQLDSVYTDEFANGIDSEKYTVVGDEENRFSLFEKQGTLKVSNLDYGLYVRTKEELTIPEGKSLVVQWDIIENSVEAGWLCYMRGHAEHGVPWSNMVWQSFNAGNQLQGYKNGIDVAGVSDDTGTQWTVLSRFATNSLMRQVYNADGSAQLHASFNSFDEANLHKFYDFAAGQLDNSALGYFGFSGNGMSGSYLIDNFKMGYASDASCSDITWLLEDDFETGDNWQIVDGKTQIGGAKYLAIDNPQAGAGIVYNTEFAKTEGVSKLYEATVNLDVTAVETGKAVGLALGLGADVTTCANAPFVGLRENAEGNGELVIIIDGQDAQVVDLGAPLDATLQALKVVTNVNEEGKIEIIGSASGKSVSHVVDSVDGRIAIAAQGSEGSFVAKLKSLDINSYKGIVRDGRSLSTDFEEELNKNWHIVSKPSPDTNGYVAVEDGKLEFELAGDGSQFGTKYEYANFELKFDIVVQQLDEDDEGNLTKPSTWPGISFARPELESAFWAPGAKLIYFQTSTIDLLNFAGNGRTWLGPEDDMHHIDNFGAVFTIRLRAENGTVELYVLNNRIENAVEKKLATWENVDTAGYVAICCTAGGNFTVDNFSITNLDGNERVNAKPEVTTAETTMEVVGGETVTGALTATDADLDALTYVLVEDNTATHGTLTLNQDGTYTFVAKEDAATGTVTFKYAVTDTEDQAEGTITINVTKANEAPVVTTTETTKAVTGGETVTGTLTATDETVVTYVLVEDNTATHGTLTLNQDGTYTFVAKEDAATGTVTFTYKVNDGELDSEVATITINVTAKEVQPEPQPSKGCKGSIIGSVITVVTLAGAVVLLKKKEQE